MKRYNYNFYQKKPFWRFDNWKMWFFGIIVPIVIVFPLYRYIKKEIEKSKSLNVKLSKEANFKENQNPILSQKKANIITPRMDIQAAAKSLSHDLGVKFSDAGGWFDFLDPRGWTENDNQVANTLIYQRKNFKLLEKLYFEIYTNSRSLRDDILTYLDDSELKRVRKYISI